MPSAIFIDGKKFIQKTFKDEEQFEQVIKSNSKLFFGQSTIYIDLKSKIDARTLGGTIPDGFLFDFKDKENPEFYIIEVELARHDFFGHVFPQITKFFSFFRRPESRNKLAETLFRVIQSDSKLNQEFKKALEGKELYKAVKDAIDESQNILLIIDEYKKELDDIFGTYTDTWDKLVTLEIIRQYVSESRSLFVVEPDFEDIGMIDLELQKGEETAYTEQFHTEGVIPEVISAYETIKKELLGFDQGVKVNPQKYYISLRKTRNFAFIKIRKKKLRVVIMLPLDTGKEVIKAHELIPLPQAVQNWYNGPCFRVDIADSKELGEIVTALKEAHKRSTQSNEAQNLP